MRIAATGFVAREAGSIASANAILLKGLLERGHQVDFFSKSSFVDPRSTVGQCANFRFHECTNHGPDQLRRALERVPLLGFLAGRLDARTYNTLLIRKISQVQESTDAKFDAVLWMGDYAHGVVPGVPSVSFAQGAPGTDARSVLRHGKEIASVAGLMWAMRLKFLAKLRLSRLGLPSFACSDHIVVGSKQSKRTLMRLYRVREENVSTMPYPVDLELFRPPAHALHRKEKTLRVLWLGRIVPRKRLDLFLDGGAEAIRRGVNVNLTVVGRVGFVPGYERLLEEFPFPARLKVLNGVSRQNVPDLLAQHDVLCQPSEEEDFGSSIAEAQACGLRVVVGYTNGNADYLCDLDIHLQDYKPRTLSDAFATMAATIAKADSQRPHIPRSFAEKTFSSAQVLSRFEEALVSALRHRMSIR